MSASLPRPLTAVALVTAGVLTGLSVSKVLNAAKEKAPATETTTA